MVSGLYPAIYISQFQSVEIFDGKLRFGRKSLLTNLFLGLQLVITCGSIACAIIFTQNNEFQHHQDWGYDKEQLLFAKAPNATGAAQLRDALIGQADIEEVVRAQNHIGENHSKVVMQFPDRDYEVDRLNVGADYLQAMGVPLSLGAYFSDDATGDTRTVIVNQTLVETLDLKEPVGQVFDIDNQRYTIAGVVSDFHNYSFFQEITPILFAIADDAQLQYVVVRTDQQDQRQVYAQLQEHWYELFPQTPFQGSYQEDVWGNYFSLLYSAERFYTALAFIAILLASLGLYGLITLNITGRKLEFCIRKALGADMIHLLKSVSRQYIVLCLVSLVIGLPVSYWMADAALDMLYAYPMPLTISGFVYAMCLYLDCCNRFSGEERDSGQSCHRIKNRMTNNR
ncbi:MAG: FtsX-like permease family protein [Bacteroidota bacterium]